MTCLLREHIALENHAFRTAMLAGQRLLVNQGLLSLASRYGKKRKRLSGLQGSLNLIVFNSLRVLPRQLLNEEDKARKHFLLWTGLFMQNRGLPIKVNLLMSIITLALQVHSEILNCLMSDHKLLSNYLIYLVHSFITAFSPFVFSFKYFRILP